MKKTVEVVDYNPKWNEQYNQLKNELLETLPNEILNIFHIGSTSIINMSAKPIIDILIEVINIKKINEYYKILNEIGYTCFGEYGITGREYLVRSEKEKHLVHVHIFNHGSEEIWKHLFFIRYLNEHEDEFDQYKNLKIENALQYKEDRDKYQEAKSELIKEIDEKAKLLYSPYFPAMRKTKNLLSYKKSLTILKSHPFGHLSISNEPFPYIVPINYVIDGSSLYFHSGLSGFKYEGLNKMACFNVVNDFGLVVGERTHHFESVNVFGKLYIEEEKRVKILNLLIDKLDPSSKMSRDCIEKTPTKVMALDLEYVIGKRHI